MNRIVSPSGLCALSLVSLLQAPIASQTPTPALGLDVRSASRPVLDAFQLRAAKIQTLRLPKTQPATLQVPVVLAGRTFTLNLRLHDIRARGFQILLDDGQRQTPIAPGPVQTYRGEIQGLKKALVAATVSQGQLWAQIHTTAGVFGVQPLQDYLPKRAPDEHLVYRMQDLRPNNTRCGVDHAAAALTRHRTKSNSNAVVEAEIAIDADFAYFSRYNKDTSQVSKAVSDILNNVDLIFTRDTGIRYKLTALVIRTQQVYQRTAIRDRLSEFCVRWRTHHAAIPRDFAHLFTGIGQFQGIVGVAVRDTVCTNNSCAISKAYHPVLGRNAALVAHEIGHNLNALHCDATQDCWIMCSNVGGCSGSLLAFGPTAKGQIIARRNRSYCLRAVGPGTYTYYGKGCRGSTGQTPELSASEPEIGSTFKVVLEKAAPNRPMQLCFGASSQQWGSLTLPFDLLPLGAKDCSIYAACNASLASVTDSAGDAAFRIAIPNNPIFVGTVFFNQAMVIDPGANTAGIALSQAGRGRVGEN